MCPTSAGVCNTHDQAVVFSDKGVRYEPSVGYPLGGFVGDGSVFSASVTLASLPLLLPRSELIALTERFRRERKSFFVSSGYWRT